MKKKSIDSPYSSLAIHQACNYSPIIEERSAVEGEEEVLEEVLEEAASNNLCIHVSSSQICQNEKNKPFWEIISSRQSSRSYGKEKISSSIISSILWASYGIVEGTFRRTVPSAGGLYPIRIYIWANEIESIKRGFYIYYPVQKIAVLNQDIKAPQNIESWFSARNVDFSKISCIYFLIGRFNQICPKYGPRGYRYLLLEAGHIAQNICLASTYLGVPHITLGGFDDQKINDALCFNTNQEACLYSIVIGKV